MRTSPMAPSRTSSASRCVCGWQRYMNASIRNTSWAAAASIIAAAARWFMPIGFSTSRCLPAAAALIAHSACAGWMVLT